MLRQIGLSLVVAVVAATTTATTDEDEECSIYLAPSSLPYRAAGMGVYTTRDLQPGERILQAPDGPSIVVLDYDHDSSSNDSRQQWIQLWDHYWWGQGLGDFARYEVEDHDHHIVAEVQATLGALANHHCLLDNLDYAFPSSLEEQDDHHHRYVPYDDTLGMILPEDDEEEEDDDDDHDHHNYSSLLLAVERHRLSPGAGALSYHMGREFVATRQVSAGSELFWNYGKEYCHRRENNEQQQQPTEWTTHTRMHQEYAVAAKTTATLWNMLWDYDPQQRLQKEVKQLLRPSSQQPQQQKQKLKGSSTRNTSGKHDPQPPIDQALADYTGQDLLNTFEMVQGLLYHAGLLEASPNQDGTRSIALVKPLIPQTTGQLLRMTKDILWKEHELLSMMTDNDIKNNKDKASTTLTTAPHNPQQHIVELSKRLEETLGMQSRTPEWIRQHGQCLEHLVPGPSHIIKHAGLGAIAQHFIQQGQVVVPAPVLHILDGDVLQMPRPPTQQQGIEEHTYSQLLVNYCYGHASTTMLLCPMTNALLINHCSTRKPELCPPGFSGPNANLYWSNSSREWLNMTLDEIGNQPLGMRGLSLDVVALQDIAPGDEVVMDYGEEWEQAWERHVAQWPKSRHYRNDQRVSVTRLNDHLQQYPQAPLPLLVAHDLRAPYRYDFDRADEHHYYFEEDDFLEDEYMMTRCVYQVSDQDDHPVYRGATFNDASPDRPQHWRTVHPDLELLDHYADSTNGRFRTRYNAHSENTYWPCLVLVEEGVRDETAEDGTKHSIMTYTVRILPSDHHDNPPWAQHRVPRILTGYPKTSIRYFPHPHSSDQHLRGAFRHAIGLDDDMIPSQWKNAGKSLHNENEKPNLGTKGFAFQASAPEQKKAAYGPSATTAEKVQKLWKHPKATTMLPKATAMEL